MITNENFEMPSEIFGSNERKFETTRYTAAKKTDKMTTYTELWTSNHSF